MPLEPKQLIEPALIVTIAGVLFLYRRKIASGKVYLPKKCSSVKQTAIDFIRNLTDFGGAEIQCPRSVRIYGTYSMRPRREVIILMLPGSRCESTQFQFLSPRANWPLSRSIS